MTTTATPMTTTVGFTGTRQGMTQEQKTAVRDLLLQLRPTTVHHGDCIGADQEFHDLVRYYLTGTIIEAHPMEPATYRAYCKADVIHPAAAPLARNQVIVKQSDTMIATPAEACKPACLRGKGTWATINYTQKQGKRLFLLSGNI